MGLNVTWVTDEQLKDTWFDRDEVRERRDKRKAQLERELRHRPLTKRAQAKAAWEHALACLRMPGGESLERPALLYLVTMGVQLEGKDSECGRAWGSWPPRSILTQETHRFVCGCEIEWNGYHGREYVEPCERHKAALCWPERHYGQLRHFNLLPRREQHYTGAGQWGWEEVEVTSWEHVKNSLRRHLEAQAYEQARQEGRA